MYTPTTNHPSFSSSLLDQIYNSIDEPHHPKSSLYTHNHFPKHSNFSINQYSHNNHYLHETNSSSTSSDSSNRSVFSSSDNESNYVVSSKPKPIRTYTNRNNEYIRTENRINMYGFEALNTKQKHETKFVKTKSRAMKMYTDLKKMKHPISPGARLSSFLNSIFTTRNSKNTKLASHVNLQSKSACESSSCSSASSFSRSCLSKTSSSRGKLRNNDHKSVRFVSVRDESNIHELKFVKNHKNDEIRARLSEKTCSIEERSRNYQKKVEYEVDLIEGNNEDDDDDNVSNTSSDLFELENICAIGIESYEDELPVFETTYLNKIMKV